MLRFNCVAFLSLAIIGVALSAPSTTPSDGDDRILHGRKVDQLEHPYQVSLQYVKGERVGKFCGGVILNKNYVLTAAHCFMGEKRDTHINAGVKDAFDYSPPSQFIKVAEVMLNDKWDPNTAIGDIALLKLETPLKMTPTVQPIQLPSKGYKASGVGEIIGWGAINNDESASSRELLSATVPVSNPSDCAKFRNFRNNNQLCLAANVKYNACAGDSGGGFIQKNASGKPIVAGITSFGAEGCYEKEPIVYTEVAGYLDWIEQNIKN